MSPFNCEKDSRPVLIRKLSFRSSKGTNHGIEQCKKECSELAEPTKKSSTQNKKPVTAGRRASFSCMRSQLRRNSKDLFSSLTKGIKKGRNSQADHQQDERSVAKFSAEEVARIVAAEYYTGESQELSSSINVESFYPEELPPAGQKEHASFSSLLSPPEPLDTFSKLAGDRAVEYLEECLAVEVSVLDREKFQSIPEYHRSDLLIGAHLGKGSFSDAFEVCVKVSIYNESALNESLRGDDKDETDELFKCFESKLQKTSVSSNTDNGFSPGIVQDTSNQNRRISSNTRGPLRNSINLSSLSGPCSRSERKMYLAMKCLRPQTRLNAENFLIGVEDLVHETAMLASLDHPNIVKLHGRAAGCLSNAFKLNDGYFILLDRLEDTLKDRIELWRGTHQGMLYQPKLNQMKVASSLADAMVYLHSKKIIFRDLKPANIGFDSYGVMKLFDFGFAVGIGGSSEDGNQDMEDSGLLYDQCGTPRYMAPEVGLCLGYGIKADVYSFGILLWEIISLELPFSNINSSDDFYKKVFVKGMRPELAQSWPIHLKELMTSCWSINASERPSMSFVRSMLCASVRELSFIEDDNKNNPPLCNDMNTRQTWDACHFVNF